VLSNASIIVSSPFEYPQLLLLFVVRTEVLEVLPVRTDDDDDEVIVESFPVLVTDEDDDDDTAIAVLSWV